ncbi:restriction endonuclease subunit S [Alteromonas sp. KUL106]|uniref:restriction endonuclease subunit S n=1 Tax=Alteromonas sp. KUL106 TaxID=2480799 RepID=UPI0012E6D2B2|nr:restriction endonuclease subunit S [Alteromonas sp. KUL106]GFD67770.1 type I restriction-modification system restriction endonuclease DNA specificity subunit HsdS [Alteromonas sp. KUL106]
MAEVNLPPEWSVCTFSDLVSSSFTGLVRSAREQGEERTFKYLKMNNLDSKGNFILDGFTKVDAEPVEIERYSLQIGDFIFNTRNSVELVGKCGVFNIKSAQPILFNNNLLKVKFIEVEPRIVAHWLNSPVGKRNLRNITSATTSVAAIYQKQLFGLKLPLCPLSEQKVIADKLDTLLAQVESTRARLERIPEILKTFRQSVLAAAVSGKLTEEWRLEHQAPESINFTEETKKERLQKGIREGKLAKDANVPYVPYEIPESWNWVRLGHLALKITDGAHNTPKVLESGFPYLMAKDLTGGQLDFSENRFVSEDVHRELYNKCQPEVGDLLVVNIGAGTGNNVLIDVGFEFSFKNIAIVKRPNYIAPGYMQYYFKSAKQRIFQDQAKGGAQPFLSLTMLNDVPFALPPQCEQTEIVRRVEELFAFADRIEQKANVALERVNNLTQSILAKAFRGELTTDWRAANPELISGENSAEALLAKIKAAREALKPVKKSSVRKKS